MLKQMFNLAISWGKTKDNPVQKVKFLREVRGVDRVLSSEEERALLQECVDHVKMAVILALNTGMRLGEVLSLTWLDVSLNKRVITVEKSKSGKTRSIPINSSLDEELHRYKRKVNHSDYLFFNDRTGRPIVSIKTGFVKAVRRAGIPACRFHDLRHTFATRLVLSGADPKTVSELLGHADIHMTMRYSHPTPEAKRAAVELLDGHNLDTSCGSSEKAGSAKLLQIRQTRQ